MKDRPISTAVFAVSLAGAVVAYLIDERAFFGVVYVAVAWWLGEKMMED